MTVSTNFSLQNPGGGGYYQPANAGGFDAFILKFTNTGVRQWATYYGGSRDDYGYSIITDGSGNVFVTGYTFSTNFPLQNPVSSAYYQPAFGGVYDAFILKFTNAGVRQWATYYGGNGPDVGNSIITDGSGNVFVMGMTVSTNFPLQNLGAGAYYQSTFAGGSTDVFILKFTSAGIREWATYYGGSGSDNYLTYDNLATDQCGNVYMSFNTQSTNLPVQNSSDGPYQDNSFNGASDIAIIKFSNAGVRLWATYLGGDGLDIMEALAVDGKNNLFVTGEWNSYTSSTGTDASYPVTNPGGGAWYNATANGRDEGHICKFIFTPIIANTTIIQPTCDNPCGGSAIVNIVPPSSYTYLWSNGQTTQTATGLCAGSYTVTVTDASGCTQSALANISTVTSPSVMITSSASVSCNGDNNGSASVSASGGNPPYTYLWCNGQTTTTATGLSAGFCNVTVTDNTGCVAITPVTIIQPTLLTATTTATSVFCNEGTGSVSVNAGGGTPTYTYVWSPSGGTSSTDTGLSAGNYTVTITDANGCTNTATAVVSVESPPTAIAAGDTVCEGETINLTSSGGGTYSWNGPNAFSSILQ